MGLVYLIHFDQPYRHARHYLGWVKTPDALKRRLGRHRRARLDNWKRYQSSKLMCAVGSAGIGWQVARTWEDKTIQDERRMHRGGQNTRLCPICRGKVA